MKRELYLPFLRSANDTQSDPESIMSEELLAQIVHQFLLTVFRPHDLPNAALWMYGDNQGVMSWLADNRACHAFQSMLLTLSQEFSVTLKTTFTYLWLSGDEIKVSGADSLSRKFHRTIRGIKVVQVGKKL